MKDVAPKPEVVSAALVTFCEELLEDDRTSFLFKEAEALAFELGYSIATPVIQGLKKLGLDMIERLPPRKVRGVRTSSNDRYFGPGSSKCHGGSGHEQISGFAGQRG